MSGIHSFRVLRAMPLWIANGVITGVLALLFAVFYVGANIDPAGRMKELPVGLVNADKGAAVGGKQVNLGAQITESIKKSTASGRCQRSLRDGRPGGFRMPGSHWRQTSPSRLDRDRLGVPPEES
ncbi:YhgE/Pip domain-containing protein [Streptomyces sp. NPDC014995]|uniref:YhgE/Pip domain-containing protein n=1 Tax=Streptomyces sp. NPDC014995 TaxID=3364936 RepID=UPI0036F4B8F9